MTSGSRRGGTAARIASPGADTSTAALAFEKAELARSASTAATVRTCGSEAGNCGWLPVSNSLPAAATSAMPRPVAISSCSYSAKQGVREP
jgi:hypothetical protein